MANYKLKNSGHFCREAGICNGNAHVLTVPAESIVRGLLVSGGWERMFPQGEKLDFPLSFRRMGVSLSKRISERRNGKRVFVKRFITYSVSRSGSGLVCRLLV